jgi:hypothetical protein
VECWTILSFIPNAGFKIGGNDGQFVGCKIMLLLLLLQKLLLCVAKHAWKG